MLMASRPRLHLLVEYAIASRAMRHEPVRGPDRCVQKTGAPIVMTTLAMRLGMMRGIGHGLGDGSFLSPMAIVVIGAYHLDLPQPAGIPCFTPMWTTLLLACARWSKSRAGHSGLYHDLADWLRA